jgi:hypothetical protein
MLDQHFGEAASDKPGRAGDQIICHYSLATFGQPRITAGAGFSRNFWIKDSFWFMDSFSF